MAGSRPCDGRRLAVVVVITLVRHRTASENDDPSETPDVIEYMTMWIGVVYAIVLGADGPLPGTLPAPEELTVRLSRCTEPTPAHARPPPARTRRLCGPRRCPVRPAAIAWSGAPF
ncbi:hypothetical protein GCM10018787_29620 [Streptomyces thermodiastaticus]|nr:hypothetical protein GCM10018787_29620 [Streptomyces thermodiastaticus]